MLWIRFHAHLEIKAQKCSGKYNKDVDVRKYIKGGDIEIR